MIFGRSFRVWLGAGLAGGLLYLLLWPVPVHPVAWTPPRAPELSGPYRVNHLLEGLERLGAGMGPGPEDVAQDVEGNLYVGVEDGRILRLPAGGGEAKPFADTGGRPMGLAFDSRGNLVVADARRGLLSVGQGGAIEVLIDDLDGHPLRRANGVDISPDGLIYFSVSSIARPIERSYEDFLDHRPTGRLLVYDPRTGRTRQVSDSLQFANGVAVAPDGAWVLVAETTAYRVRRVWVKGERAGRSEVLIDNLPGFPDGVTSDGRGRFWVALAAPRNRLFDALLPHPFLRRVIARLPSFLWPAPRRYGFILAVDSAGGVVRQLQDPRGSFAPITNVTPAGDTLYLGSILEDAIGRLALPGVGAPR
ncbi:MAG: SMP-30/gluconolactonase/LRE family protein [Gemmatimonadota bacterium]